MATNCTTYGDVVHVETVCRSITIVRHRQSIEEVCRSIRRHRASIEGVCRLIRRRQNEEVDRRQMRRHLA